MTHSFPFQGPLSRYWDVLYSEYRRLTGVLANPPFEFELAKTININEYIPKNGDEIMITFWDKDHRRELLTVEAELLPDETEDVVHVVVHPHVNSFEEPGKSAMVIWKGIKSALKRSEKRRAIKTSKRKKKRKPQTMTLNALEELREIYFETLRSKKSILPRIKAANKVGISINTWREHDLELWNHWEDEKYRNQNMQ